MKVYKFFTEKINVKTTYRLIVLGLLALGLMVGASLAWAQSSAGVIRACVKDGKLQTIGLADQLTCAAKEQALDWSIMGPQGATGQQGEQGIQGSIGPAGPQGPSGPPGPGITIVQLDRDIPVTAFTYSEHIDCPYGYHAIGGGYSLYNFSAAVFYKYYYILGSYPENSLNDGVNVGRYTVVLAHEADDPDVHLLIRVICADLGDIKLVSP